MLLPPKDNVRDGKSEALVIGAVLSCSKCNINTSITFSPSIRYNPEFIDQKPKLICPTCKNPYSSIPHFSFETWRIFVRAKYDPLKKVVEDNLSHLWLAIEFILAIRSCLCYRCNKRIHLVKGYVNKFSTLITLDSPSGELQVRFRGIAQ